MNRAVFHVGRQFISQNELYILSSRLNSFRRLASVKTNKDVEKDAGKQEKDNSEDVAADSQGNTLEENLKNEVAQLNESLTNTKEKYQRSLAENENILKRMRREVQDAKLFGIQAFCKDLLEVADVVSMAVSSVPSEILNQQDQPHFEQWKNFYDGVSMTNSQLLKVFERHGLVPLSPSKGDKFDPKIHEALFVDPGSELEPGSVAHVQKIGYSLHGRTLRPAQVGVAKAAP